MNKRERILEKTQGHCAYCGNIVVENSMCEIEHMIPKSRGGSNAEENLVASCWCCNMIKNTRTPHEFKAHLLEHGGDGIDNIYRGLDSAVNELRHFQRFHSSETRQAVDNIIEQILDLPTNIDLSGWPHFYYTDFPKEQKRDEESDDGD